MEKQELEGIVFAGPGGRFQKSMDSLTTVK